MISNKAGVDTDAVQSVSTKPTGVALILVDRAGENAISVASGANTDVTPDDLERHRGLIATADVCLLQLELPVSTVIRAIELCKEHGVCSVLDTAPASATRYANAAGAVACLTLGAQPSMPTEAQITSLLQSG